MKTLSRKRSTVPLSSPTVHRSISLHDVLRAPGRPLDAAVRSTMESRFGHDFSRVRVHDDGQAEASADAFGARAYTVGNQIVFGRGSSTHDSALLVHELAHVVQQKHVSPLDPPEVLGDHQFERNVEDHVRNASSALRATSRPTVLFQEETVTTKTPLERAQTLLDEATSTVKTRAGWLIKAADERFVTFNTTKARQSVEDVRDGKKVEKMDPAAADYDVPILEVEVGLVRKAVQSWVDGKGLGTKSSIQLGSFIRASGPHAKGKAIDINNLNMTTSVDMTVAIIEALDASIATSYGIGMPFQGDFFDPADKLETKRAAAETAAKEDDLAASVTGALVKFAAHIYRSDATRAKGKAWKWKETIESAGLAYTKLKSETLKNAFAERRKDGLSFMIFPDNDNHLHVDRR